jgi:hypothetical protein
MNSMEQVAAQEAIPESQGLWSDFASSDNLQEYFGSWLALQSGMIAGTVQGLLVMAGDNDSFSPVAGWPRSGTDPELLADVVERALDKRCGLLSELAVTGRYAIAYPILTEGELLGVVALEISAIRQADLQRAMEQLQWGVAWLELAVVKREAETDRNVLRRLKVAVDLLAVVLGQESFETAAMAFATELSAAGSCERVSLGLCKGTHVRLQAVSHSAAVGEKMNLTRSIERVMDEAVLQRREIVYPPLQDEGQIYREHEALSRQQSMASIMSYPLYANGRYFGAVTCERAADMPFTEPDIAFIRSVADLTGTALEGKYANDRPLSTKIGLAARQQLQRLFGEGFVGRKFSAVLLLALGLFLFTAEGEYRLTAATVIEGSVQRVIVVPFDGYIDQAPARAGDLVEEGALLSALDERDLRLEKLAKESKHRQLENRYQEALAKHDRAEAAIIRTQLEQLQAELDLLASRLERTRLTAPFAGLIVSGDLSQRLGGAVRQGEVLFEITPLDLYRVILKVDERRIADVVVGQEGDLVLSSLPQKTFPFTVDKVTSIATAEDGRNYFRVEAHLAAVDESLRPGMEGIGKIGVDRRRLVGTWSRDLREWVRLTLWKWLP